MQAKSPSEKKKKKERKIECSASDNRLSQIWSRNGEFPEMSWKAVSHEVESLEVQNIFKRMEGVKKTMCFEA